MNINSPSLLSLLAPVENQDGLLQPIVDDESIAKAFTETLAETIKQIQGLGKADTLKENSDRALSDSMRQLHQIAGKINQNRIYSDVSSFVGKNLPLDNKLEKQIDLEDTLNVLSNVMQTLEVSVSDRQEPDIASLDVKLDSMLEKLDDLQGLSDRKDEISGQIKAFSARLEQLKEVVGKHIALPINEQTKTSELSTERGLNKEKGYLSERVEPKKVRLPTEILLKTEQDDGSQLEQDTVEKITIDSPEKQRDKTDIHTNTDLTIQQMPELDARDQQAVGEALLTTRLIEQVESVVDAFTNLQNHVLAKQSVQHAEGLNDRLSELSDDVAVLEQMLTSEKVTAKQNETKGGERLVAVDDQDQEILIDEQILAIVSSLESALKNDEKSTAHLMLGDRSGVNNESTTVKQLVDERTITFSGKQSDDVIKQEQSAIKPGLDASASLQKQDDKLEQIDGKGIEGNDEKSTLKFATDMANLNRSFRLDSKGDAMSPMRLHFSHPEWNKEMAERVIWMHKKEIPSAELRLNPRHLGPIAIKIDVANDQAGVTFTAHHAAVKDAIESAIPKLREMFNAQQLNLTEVNVSQEDAGQRQSKGFAQWENAREESRRNGTDEVASSDTTTAQEITEEIETGRAIASNGVLSLFA